MIKSVLIMEEGGIAIFSYEAGGPIVDEQLISGFLVAVRDLTREAFLDSLQTLQMQDNQLVFGFKEIEDIGKLFGAIISDNNDNAGLVAELLDQLLEQFMTKYEADVKQVLEKRVQKEFEGFKNDIEQVMESRLRKPAILQERNKPTLTLGWIVGLILFFLGLEFNLWLWGKVGATHREIAGLSMAITLLILPGGIAGWVAGNGRNGLIAAGGGVFVGTIILAVINVETLINWIEKIEITGTTGAVIAVLTALLVLVPAYGLFGYLMGSWVDRRYLYPSQNSND
ncbi:MAG: hypothetical protein ACE5R6_12395 [Candidatus Heimdallarchaeota archaeon]